MIRRPPRSTLDRSSAASDVYKRQFQGLRREMDQFCPPDEFWTHMHASEREFLLAWRVLIDDALERNARKSGVQANGDVIVSKRQSIDIEF